MRKTHSKITAFFALFTLLVFALCILLVLLTGATVYRDLVDHAAESHTHRTALGYLTSRVRQADSVTVSDFQGCDALLLEETVSNETYITRIYCWDGWLRELYSSADSELAPEDGEPLLETEVLACAQEDNFLALTLGQDCIYLYLPAKTEVTP